MSESATPEQGTFLLHRNRGRDHFEAEEYALARRDLELARSIRNDDPDVMYWLAMVDFRLDRHEEAESLFASLITLRPGHASLHVNRGIALFKLDRTDEAEREFRQALALDGGGNRPHLYLGLAHARRGEDETALGHFEQAGASLLALQMRQRLGWGRERRVAAPVVQAVAERELAPPETPTSLPKLRPAVPDWSARRDDSTASDPVSAMRPPVSTQLPARGVEARPTPTEIPRRDPDSSPAGGLSPLVLESRIVAKGSEATVHGGALLRMTFRGLVVAHRKALVGSAGSLSFERFARHEELVRVMGDGSLYLVSEERRISLIQLRDETFHLVMGHFVASLGDLAREVSTAVESGSLPMRTIGLRGNGMVGLSTAGRPLAVEVQPGCPLTLSTQRVAGWMGSLKVSWAPDDPTAVATGFAMLRFEGGGKVILDVPEGHAPAPEPSGGDAL